MPQDTFRIFLLNFTEKVGCQKRPYDVEKRFCQHGKYKKNHEN